MDQKLKIEKRILNISLIGSIAFLVAEIILALITKSNAVITDCIYDIADLIMIGPFILLIPLLYKNETEKKPYGFSQIESLFVLIKSGLLIGVTIFLIINGIETILDGGNQVDAGAVAIFELIVSAICVIMYIVLSKLNKKYTSPSIKAEVYIWKLDAISTLGVGLAFILKLILDKTSMHVIGPYIDPSIAILLALLLLKEPLGIFIESLKNLVLFAPNEETTEKIRKICEEELSKYDCYINFLDIIKTGRKIWIQIYFVLEKNTISIEKMRELNKSLKEKLTKEFDSINVELIPDLDEVNIEKLKTKEVSRRPDKLNYVNKIETKKQTKKVKSIERK